MTSVYVYIDDRPRILENLEWPYLCNGTFDPLRVRFYGGVFGPADRMALLPVRPNTRRRPENFESPYVVFGTFYRRK